MKKVTSFWKNSWNNQRSLLGMRHLKSKGFYRKIMDVHCHKHYSREKPQARPHIMGPATASLAKAYMIG